MSAARSAARKAAVRLPKPLRERVRSARRRYLKARYRWRERLRPTTLDVGETAAALAEAGLQAGDACFVQGAMSAFGSFEHGAETVLDAFERVVGADGLVTMPAYTVDRPAIEYLAEDPVFDLRATPSRMGAVSEAFRLRAGTARSLHPTHSVCARGAGAQEAVAGHERAPAPFGAGTPWRAIVERDALQVFFGTGPGPMTAYHDYECVREPPFPFDVYARKVFQARCVDGDGRELTVRALAHAPELLPGRIDSNPRLQALFRDEMLAAGARAVPLGRGEILAMRMSALYELFERLLGRGITIYERPVPDAQPELKPQERVDG